MPLVRPHHKYRGVDSFTADDLVAVSSELLRSVAPVQTRYRVGAVPTPRSLRFYTARGLLDKPFSTAGGRARYGYRHLLQILAVKFLQSQYLPLVKIRGLVANAGNRDLEQLLPDVGPAPLRSLVAERTQPPSGAGVAVPAVEAEPGPGDAWHRVEVGPGIELHVHHATLRPEERERLRGALLREMGRIRGWGAPR